MAAHSTGRRARPKASCSCARPARSRTSGSLTATDTPRGSKQGSTEAERSQRTQGDDVLKNIDPLLNADVLYALQSMGHGDELVICDAHFPADSIARETVLGKLLRIDAVPAARVVKAVLSVLPLDTFVDAPALRMEVVGAPQTIPGP